jgi:Ser/Thr protein kinase RdoA (MazF antagonist)
MMNATEKAHGLDGSLTEPDWAPMTMADVRRIVTRFPDCGQPIKILSVSPRPFSAACVVATTSGRVFIKRHHCSVRNAEGLLEEHRFLAYLRARGAQVPHVFVDGSGESAIELGAWTYEAHEAPAGADVYADALSWTPFHSVAHALAAGRALALLHIAAEGFEATRRKPRPLVASFTIFAWGDPAEEMIRYLAARPALAQDAAVQSHARHAVDLLAPFHAELTPWLPSLKPLWTHNDLHASNLLWRDESYRADVAAIIDFGLADHTNAVHDLAHAIERNIVEWLVLVNDPLRPDRVPVHFEHLHALLDGYESVRPLSDEEAAALAPMTALCHAEFALSEADYFLGVLHSEEKARMAYDGWLVGHARWFTSDAGKQLLNTLRRRALDRKSARDRA